MGGKNSSGSATTTPTIPPWIQGILQPLLTNSASRLSTLQGQGFDVLQGKAPGSGASSGQDSMPPGVSLEELERVGGGGRGGGSRLNHA